MTLRDLPPVRALAEERAAVRISVAFQVAKRFDIGSADAVAVELAILTDLRLADSRDALVRLVERFGDASDADKARHHRDNPGELEALALAVLA